MAESTGTSTASHCRANPDPSQKDPDYEELKAVIYALKPDPTFLGATFLGKDGVLRSLTADRDVVDAVGLSPRLIAAFLRFLEPDPTQQQKELADYEGVDGTVVPKDKWFCPDKSLLPEPLSEELREESRKLMEEHPEIFGEKEKKG